MTKITEPRELIEQLTSKIQVETSAGVEAKISFNKKKWSQKRPFGVTGPIKYKNSYYKHDRLDPFDRIIALTKTGQKVFQEIKDRRDKDLNLSTMYIWEDLDKSQARYNQRGIKDLIKYKIVCKVKAVKKYSYYPEANTFMINPYIIKCNKYIFATNLWFELTSETDPNKEEPIS